MKNRLYFLDNFRTFLIFLVVVLHAGISYSYGMDMFWIVVDPEKNETLGLVNMYLDLFVMFNMFFISGYFIPISVKSKTASEFLKSKFRRIMVPWLIAIFTLIPAYKAIFLYARGLPQESWYTYFTFFNRPGADANFYANNPTLSWLWFLPVLFLFQIIYLGLSKTNLLSIKISLRKAVLFIFLFGLIYSLMISFGGLTGWFHSPFLDFQRERLVIYFMSFLLGSLCFKLKVFDSEKKRVKENIWANVLLTVSLGIFTVFALNAFFNLIDPARNYFIMSLFLDKVTYYATALISMLSFLYVLVYLFRFKLNTSNNILKNLNKSSYGVYIIHMIVLGFIALLLVNLPASALIKFVFLTVTTYVISNLIVLAYYRWFKYNTTLRLSSFLVLIAALIIFIVQANKAVSSAAFQSHPSERSGNSFDNTGIHEAVISGNAELVRELISTGSNPDEKDPEGGSSPLITAALFDKPEIVNLLIAAGADVNFKNKEGSTPLITAAFFCRTEIVKTLLDNGADISIRNNAGSQAYDAVSGPFESVKGIYDFFQQTYGPLGLELDQDQLKETRPMIADMLKNRAAQP